MIRLAAFLLAAFPQESPAFRAGFAEIDITPPIGIPMQGANAKQRAEKVADPLFARAAVFERGPELVGFIQLDLACISAEDTAAIRRKIAADHGTPALRVMVTATHNHAGPAVIDEALPRDQAWVDTLVGKASTVFGKALEARQEAQAGAASVFEWELSFNRRIVMRDGTVRTHGSFKSPDALRFEGPIDPEVAVYAARGKDGKIAGAIVNFACHPGHYWAKCILSGGYPGAVARALKEKGVPVTLFLQGAAGNLHHQDPRGFPEKTLEEIGQRLADDAEKAIGKIKWKAPSRISARSKMLEIPYRTVTEADLQGTAKGAQRFGEKGYYDRKIAELLEVIKRKNGVEPAEVQVFRLDDVAFAAQPSESFAEHGLRIKEETSPARTFVVCYANGMLGYLPHVEGFKRGGYEATFGPPSCMAPDAGDRLADAAIELIRATRP